MALAALKGDISTLAVHHQAIVVSQDSMQIQAGRIDSLANEIQELRNEKRISGDIQEQVIKMQEQIEDIQKIYLKKIDTLETELKNVKIYILQFVKEMENKYPVELEDD